MGKAPLANKPELLVVDDEVALCKTLSTMFEGRGVTVATATTARAALEQVQRKHPDAVLLDLKLPDSSGFIVLSKLKAQFPDLRVVIISALSDEKTIQEALHRGASGYLPKPFDFDRCFYTAMGVETEEVGRLAPDPNALARIPEAMAIQHRILPLQWDDAGLRLAMADPLDAARREELKALLSCEIHPVAAVGGDLIAAIRRCYHVAPQPTMRPPASSTAAGARAIETDPKLVRLLDELIRQAHTRRATDLHLGIGSRGPWARERIDGMLHDLAMAPPLAQGYAHAVTHLKVLANLDPAEHRTPQQGHIAFAVEGETLDLRLSVLPAASGEHVAIRILQPSRLLALDQLGLIEPQRSQLESLLTKPSSLLLVTGPSGCGKSSTLYAVLSKLNVGRANIVTIEDTVEYELSGLTQVPLQSQVQVTFARALRAALQHDPDIVMVGELRDEETAALAVRTALTGHLVLSSLHMQDTASAVIRLLDFRVEPYFLCSTLSGILSQRLVRKLCTACREPSNVEAAALMPLGVEVPNDAKTVSLWRAKGCEQCSKTGYHGRTGLFELLVVDHHLRSLIIKGSPAAQMRQSAISRGMLTLAQSGWRKVEAGETTLEELLRALPADPR